MGAETELPLAAICGSKMNMGSENAIDSEFPAGLRVLVVDDDRICLLILDRMLRQCLYNVTKCERAVEALRILRENKDGFDLVISDVHMPDMDGFKLLELVGLEMDLPVIMMSANGETSAVMKGIKHGACDYLLKPVRIEELKNIWQHVVRRKKKGSDSLDDRQKPDDGWDSQGNDGVSKNSKKRKDAQEEEDDTELENEDPSTSKKPRVVWSVDLHQKFVSAVDQLGIDKAVPKRILELMNVRGLTRENVASHLQKYRLYLKRISGVAHQPAGGIGSAFFGATDGRFIAAGGKLGDFRAHLSPQALVSSLQAGLLERASLNSPDPYLLRQIATIHGINNSSVGRSPYGLPLLNNPDVLHSAISSGLDFKHLGHGTGQLAPFGQPDKGPDGLSALQLSAGITMGRQVGLDNYLPADNSNNSLLMQMLQLQTSSQMATGMLSDTSISGQQMVSADVGMELSKINSSLNIVGSHLMTGQEATISGPSFESSTNGLASIKGNKGVVDARPYNNASHVGIYNISLASSMPSPSISHGSEAGIVVSGKPGLICNADEGMDPTLQVASSNHVVSGRDPAGRLGTGVNNWQSWHGMGFSQDIGHNISPLSSSHYNRGFATSQASYAGCPQEQRLGWVPKFHDTDFKPLVTTTIPVCSGQGFGGKDKFKEAPFESLLGSKADSGMISEPFSSDDLLSSYIKQQQEVMGLTEGELAAESYTVHNM